MEMIKLISRKTEIGMQGKCFLQLPLLVFGKLADYIIQIAEVVNTVGPPFFAGEFMLVKIVGSFGVERKMLIIISKSQMIQLMYDVIID